MKASAPPPTRRSRARRSTSASPRKSPTSTRTPKTAKNVGGPEVGTRRSGRLVAPDEGAHSDVDESDLVAEDVGFDGAAASAEEAAIHVVDDEENFELSEDDDTDLRPTKT